MYYYLKRGFAHIPYSNSQAFAMSFEQKSELNKQEIILCHYFEHVNKRSIIVDVSRTQPANIK